MHAVPKGWVADLDQLNGRHGRHGRQKTEDRRQKTEGRRQKTEDRELVLKKSSGDR